MKRSTIWQASAVAFLLYAIVVWFIGPLLKLQGSGLWLVRFALWILGLGATVLIAWYYARRAPEPIPSSATGDDVDVAFHTARSTLAASRKAPGGLSGLPLVIVLGPESSAKTTSVVRGGMEAELLAGEVFRGETTAPTANVNVWYVENAAIVEAGGTLTANAERWSRLIPHLQPRRVAAAFGRGDQAPRAAIVCVSGEEILKPGGAEALQGTAKMLRERLAELSQQLGVRLPVYVLFTKMDRLPFFADYVQNLTRDEAREVLGFTMPAEVGGGAGQYADRQAARVGTLLENLFRSLADKRLPLLAREHAEARRLGAYEFPREWKKLAPVVTQFVVDLCRPSQLQVYPFLRGVYFTGVQAVIVNDAAAAAYTPRQEQAQGGAVKATSVFQQNAMPAAAAPVPAAGTARKVPRWDFLARILPDVVLADKVAMGVTRGGTRVNIMRRIMIAAVVVLALIAATGFTISYAGNRGLVNGVRDGARDLAAIPSSGAELPTIDALRRLDSLRARVVELETYERDGPPMHLTWGLYHGSDVLPAAKKAYFTQFASIMFDTTRGRVVSSLRGLPDAPRETNEYGGTYNGLKAYLITTSESLRSTPEFLSPVLMTSWLGSRTMDADRQQIARRQFDYYANTLRTANPYPGSPDAALVTHTRRFLLQFAGGDRIYQFMLSEAAKGNPSIQFNRKVPGSSQYLVDGYEVPAAFTRSGWTFMQGAFANADRFFQGESWVLGEQSLGQVDRAKVIDELKTRYKTEYAQHWRQFLRAATVVRFGGLKDASQKLSALSGNQSPILTLLSIASQNTAVDTVSIGPIFQPVQMLVPPTATDKLIGDKNAGYMTALVTLQSSIDQAANAQPGQAEGPVSQSASNAAQAKVTTKQLAQAFNLDRVGHVEATVQQLLEAPISYAEGLTRNFGTAELNGKGRALCSVLRPLLGKFPFSPSATQATMADVAQVFRPQTGALWVLYDEVLQKSLVKVGTQYVQKEGTGTPPLAPAFVAFFNRAAGVTQALYQNGGTDLRMPMVIRPLLTDAVPASTLTIDGQRQQFNRKAAAAKQFIWTGTQSGNARLSAQVGSTEVQLLSFDGPWAMFQLFQEADRWTTSGGLHAVEWSLRTRGQQSTLPDGSALRVGMELSLEGLQPVMQKGYLGGLGCVGDIAR
ncbi:MAG: hypothetical protein M3081_07115 [Gemmatimonadota bacterium]|nr:hypothetical protein [Gemmatimonadota bacterium]